MGSKDCFVDSSQGNPGHCVPMAEQCNRSVEGQRWGIFQSTVGKVVVVETPSVSCCQCVRGREMH